MMKDLQLFGEIKYIRSARTQSIRITIRSNKLTVSVPRDYTPIQARNFVIENYDSIRAKQELLKEKEKRSKRAAISPQNPLQTLTFRVVPNPTACSKIHYVLKNGELRIDYPTSMDIEEAQTYFWNGIDYFLRKEAKRLFPTRVAELATQYGFSFEIVKIQASKSCWGSCSMRKNINLSFYLLLAPQYLIDYVILHELCHTVEMNHSDRFWALMDKVTDGKSKELRHELKAIQIRR